MHRSSTYLTPRARPLKRPRQARARFTVQAIYDAYVRIWQRDGWEGLTTRKVALETGIAVGTLYDYFPSKEALHSGYVRHCIERLLEEVEQRVVMPECLGTPERLHRLIQLLGGLGPDQPSWFHPDMMRLEPLVADRRHQVRAYEELLAMWQRVLAACTDLPRPATPETVEALHLAVWGGRRYALQVGLDQARMVRWAEETERMCLLMLGLAPAGRPG